MDKKNNGKNILIIIESSIRLGVFIFIVFAYFIFDDISSAITSTPFFGGLTSLHAVWALMMGGMVLHLFPNNAIWAANNKQFGNTVRIQHEYNQRLLYNEIKKMNDGAKKVLTLWIAINAVIILLYFYGVIGGSEIILIVALFYVCDAFCMFVWCPLQHFFMKARCCINCRIYGWGYFLVYAPLFIIVDFFTWSLAIMSLILLIRWEIIYFRHTERFWAGSNAALQCSNCSERSCELKRHLSSLRLGR